MRFGRYFRSLVCVLAALISFGSFTFFYPLSSKEVQAASAEEQFWYSLSSQYYYSKLDERERMFYDIVNRACMEVLLSDETVDNIVVDISSLNYTRDEEDTLINVMRLFYGANPQYFFNRNSYSYASGSHTGKVSSFTVKIYDDFKNGATRSAMRETIRSSILEYEAAVPSGSMPETIEKIVHDKMCLDIDYDYQSYYAGDTSRDQTIFSAVNGLTVCNGYALFFEALMNHFGIPCVYDSSDGHAWNIINLHGFWYYVDTTWDDRQGTDIYYKFYNCSTAIFASDNPSDMHAAEDIYDGILPAVVYDGLSENYNNGNSRYYSDRYFTVDGCTYFIVNDVDDAYGLLAMPVNGTGSSQPVSYEGRTYGILDTTGNVIVEVPTEVTTSTPTPTPAPGSVIVTDFVWYDRYDDNHLVQSTNFYSNANLIDLDCIVADGSDISNLFYRVWYNGVLVHTSQKGTYEGYFRISSAGASVIDTASGRCLAPGTYTIRFYNGDEELGGDTCTVTAESVTALSDSLEECVRGVTWYYSSGNSGNYNNTSVIDLDIDLVSGTDHSDIYYQVRYNGNLVYTSDRGFIEGYFRTTTSGASTTTVNDHTYLAAGSYKISFYYGDGIFLAEDTATVTVSYVTPAADTQVVTPTPTQPDLSSDNITPVTETGVAGFVERLYTVALNRSSDPVGKQDWIDAITQRGETGASAARGFLYSAEFEARNLSNSNFVRVLYLTFFNRDADAAGLNAWVSVLDSGGSRQEVVEGFINSVEWANLCMRYGINSGGTASPNIEVEPNQGTIDFCTRLYTTCLNRSADQGGLMAWARQLANRRDSGTGAARGFFFSSEFLGQNVSNGEYVTRLYRTFMGREPDSAGYNAWVGQLDSGVSREEVFDGFAGSNEFGQICASYGILR